MSPGSLAPLPRPRGRPARLRALGLSLALHAGLGLLLLRALPPGSGPVAPAPAPTALEIELITEAAPESPAAAVPAPAPGPVPERAVEAEPPTARRAPVARRDPRPSEPPPLPAASEAEPPATSDEPPVRRPSLLGLTPRFEIIDRLTRQGVIAPPDPGRAPPPETPRPSAFAERLAQRSRNDAARANVAAGKVHPQLYDFLRDARRGFTPSPAALDADPRAPSTVGRSFKQWGRGTAEMYRGWRRALDDQRQRLDHDPDRRGAPDVLEHYNRLMEGTARAVEPMDTLVCLVVRREAVPEVILTGSSGNAEVDRAAVEALRRSANTRPLDEDVRPQTTCYRFRATVHRIPPVPIVGCSFDEATLSASCYYPTMKVRKTTVNLESVDYDG